MSWMLQLLILLLPQLQFAAITVSQTDNVATLMLKHDVLYRRW